MTLNLSQGHRDTCRFNADVSRVPGIDLCEESSVQFGYIVLTTSAGIMDHDEARRKNMGGKVLGFFY